MRLALIEVEALLLLVVNGLQELVNIGLLFVHIYLVIALIFGDVAFFHQFVFLHELGLEFVEESVISRFKAINMLTIICQSNFLSDNCKMRTGGHTRLLIVLIWRISNI